TVAGKTTFRRQIFIVDDKQYENSKALSLKVGSSSHNWQFLVAVLATAISVSILIALLAKCQVVRRYLASYRHTRLREVDTISQFLPTNVDRKPIGGDEEDDDGFIEDNYIQASERERAERAAENMEDTEEELDEIEFTIA
uniref:Chromosome 1 open reading frame 210 n=1 Tax=Sphaeramia orbicularis TaxID=375764 RepID=A0A673C9P2_9TELE